MNFRPTKASYAQAPGPFPQFGLVCHGSRMQMNRTAGITLIGLCLTLGCIAEHPETDLNGDPVSNPDMATRSQGEDTGRSSPTNDSGPDAVLTSLDMANSRDAAAADVIAPLDANATSDAPAAPDMMSVPDAVPASDAAPADARVTMHALKWRWSSTRNPT